MCRWGPGAAGFTVPSSEAEVGSERRGLGHEYPRPSSVSDCNTHLSQREIPDTKPPERPAASHFPPPLASVGIPVSCHNPGAEKTFPQRLRS